MLTIVQWRLEVLLGGELWVLRCGAPSFIIFWVAAMKVFTLTIVGRERSPPVSIVGRCNGVSTNWCINLQNHTVVSKVIYVKKAHIFGGRTLNFLIYFPWKWMKISWFAGFYYCAFTFGVPFSVQRQNVYFHFGVEPTNVVSGSLMKYEIWISFHLFISITGITMWQCTRRM